MEKERGSSEFLKQLSGIMRAPEKRRALHELKGGHAQSLIDFFNTLLLAPDFQNSAEPWLRKYTLVSFRRLCEKSMLYPQIYVLSGIKNISHKDGGGFCDILQGTYNGQILCLKAVRLYEKSDKVKLLKAFAREAILWSQLDHPNITPFYGIFYLDEAQHRICLVSPWMENGNIKVYLEMNPQAPRKPFIYDIIKGLEYLHTEDIIHGDLKGPNVLVNESRRACLADFGLSTVVTNKTLGFTDTTTAVSGCTNRWASPELLENDSRPTRESDIWAFGCVCYEVLTRLLPFQECSNDVQVIRQLISGNLPARPGDAVLDPADKVDERMWALMNRCWSVKAEMRPTSLEISRGFEPGPSIQRSRNAHPGDFARKHQGFRRAMGNNSGVPINLNQVGQILEELHGLRSEPMQTGTWWEKDGAVPDSQSNAYQENTVLEELPLVGGAFRSGGGSRAPGPFPDNLDINTIPPMLKNVGPGWFAVFNPKVKRRLGVNLVRILRHESPVCAVRFSADGKYLATGCDRTAQIYDSKTGQEICVLFDESARKDGSLYIRSVCFSPNGRFLATAAEDKLIRLWDITKKRICTVFEGHQEQIYSLNFSIDGRLIVSGSADRTVRIWSMVDNTSRVFTIDAGVTSVAISPNGRYVAAGVLDATICIWDIQTGELLERLLGHRDSVCNVVFTPDRKGLVSGSLDRTLMFWDISVLVDGPGAAAGRGKNWDSPGAAAGRGKNWGSPGVAAGRGKNWERLDKRGPSMVNFTADGHKDCVLCLAISRDGQWVVSGSKDCDVRFWDAKNGASQCMLRGHENSVVSVDFSPMGGMLATGCDRMAKIWKCNPV